MRTASSSWNCPRKVKSADISSYAGCLGFFASQYISGRHITSHRHSAAGAEAQVTALLERVKELTGMPVSADLFTTAPVLQIL
jgi:hypothetical protein